MSDIGDSFKGLRAAIQHGRDRSNVAALKELSQATEAALAIGIELVVGSDGQQWQFKKNGSLILNFWPSSAKAMKIAGSSFRCNGWRHALHEAMKISKSMQRGSDRWSEKEDEV